MRELHDILSRWRAGGPALADAVLATVVHVRGSAYRRPGARMLIASDGTRIGTVSGGCLETEVVKRAWWWTDGGATVRVFDNTTEDAARDFGLGCNGVISVLLERSAAPSATRLLTFLDRHQRARRGAVVATVIASAAGSHLAVGDRATFAPEEAGERELRSLAPIAAAARETARERTSRLVHLDDADVFVEWIGPRQRLFVFGGGHDAAPLAAIADMLGWQVTVADGRPGRLDPARFPAAELATIPPSGDVSALAIDGDDAVVVMTHNYPQDARLLPHLVAARPRYLGLLGPRRRAERLCAEVDVDLHAPNLHAPIGLDLGGDRPEAIALAITAEIQAVVSGAAGGHLRALPGAIHRPALELRADRDDAVQTLGIAV